MDSLQPSPYAKRCFRVHFTLVCLLNTLILCVLKISPLILSCVTEKIFQVKRDGDES